MKDWPRPSDPADPHGRQGLVLVGLGSAVASGPVGPSPLQRATTQLAQLLMRPMLRLNCQADPDAAQTALAEQAQSCSGDWLAGLEIDVGLPLGDGRCWAEALGAWRQPALLVIPSSQLACGLPAAATALLRQSRVPLLGLLQWGGSWMAEARRRDGLPWLGHLQESVPGSAAPQEPSALDIDGGRALVATLTLRWQQLDRA